MGFFNYFRRKQYKLNRPLVANEKQYHIWQKEMKDIATEDLIPSVSVIRMNSTYLELTDKLYGDKGMSVILTLTMLIACSTFLIYALFLTINESRYYQENLLFLLFIYSTGIPFILFIMQAINLEWFSWTHYPIRFNRKNRQVYVHRLDGTLFIVPWDKLYFTAGDARFRSPLHPYYLTAHLLAEDGETVLESFSFPYFSNVSREELFQHWEFVRRYMDEGPASVREAIEICAPIEHQREGFLFGFFAPISWSYGLAIANIPILLMPVMFFMVIPLTALVAITRYIGMLTCKIPRWSADIDKECQVDPDDPYNVSAADNPKDMWRRWITGDTKQARLRKLKAEQQEMEKNRQAEQQSTEHQENKNSKDVDRNQQVENHPLNKKERKRRRRR